MKKEYISRLIKKKFEEKLYEISLNIKDLKFFLFLLLQFGICN